MSSLKKLFKRPNRDNSTARGPLASQDTVSTEHPQGLEIVYEDPEASLDIVAVHGLNGHREKTWTAANSVHWLRDLLPKDLPGVRVLSWGYDANTHSSDRASCQYLYDHALELVSDLTRKRKLTQSFERPIIFVAHSLGGLVVKSALIHSDAARQDALYEHRSIKTSTYGVIYIGTPHQGGNGVQLGRVLVNVASIFIAADDRILKHLERDSEWLQQQLSQYNPISNQFVTKFAYETYQTPTILGHKILVVPKASAVVPGQANAEPIAIHSDHINMVKFSENTDRGYIKVSETLQIMAKDAGEKIRSRWDTEARIDKARGDNVNKSAPSFDTLQTNQRYYYLPFPKNNRFTGRDLILDTLKKRLFVSKECQRLAVVGLGGVGKTQVALQLAYWVKEAKPDYSVFWVSALSDGSFEQAYTEMARQLDIQIRGNEDLNECVRRYFESERAGKWLMIVDNADDNEIVFGPSDKPGGIDKYLPESNNGLTVFTTRSREVAVDVAKNNLVDLHEMSVDEATEFLKKALSNKQLLQDITTTKELFQELTYLPLAIAQAAAYLNKNTQMSIGKYLALLRGTERDLVSLMSREFRDNTRYRESQNAVATTWLVSFDQIRRSDSNAAKLLSFLSCIEPKAIPRSILPKPLVEEEMEHAIGMLCGYAFLVQREEDMFDMHRLVHIAIRVWVQKENSIRETKTSAIQHLASIFPFSYKENRSLWRQYLPHAQHALQVSQDYQDKERVELFYRVGRCLYTDRRFKEAIVALEEAYQWKKQHLEEEDYSRLASEHELASAYLNDRRIEEAIEILEHVIAVQKNMLNEEDNLRLSSEQNLASAYLDNGRIGEAIAIFEHVVAVRKNVLNEKDYSRLASEQNLASAYLTDRRIKEAIEILEYVVAVQKNMLNEEDNLRLSSEQNLASAYLDNGRIGEAIAILEHVVAVEKRLNMSDEDRRVSEDLLAKAHGMR
ncbi:hypothetical protein F4803DRAFT_529566 [Xylaria telfairii]|nr:hypothetical protein F4803DRAFT_529566 [Xylaria telfairii]